MSAALPGRSWDLSKRLQGEFGLADKDLAQRPCPVELHRSRPKEVADLGTAESAFDTGPLHN